MDLVEVEAVRARTGRRPAVGSFGVLPRDPLRVELSEVGDVEIHRHADIAELPLDQLVLAQPVVARRHQQIELEVLLSGGGEQLLRLIRVVLPERAQLPGLDRWRVVEDEGPCGGRQAGGQ